MHQCVPCVPKIWNWTSKIMPDLWLSAIFCEIKKITPPYCTFFPQKVTLKIEFKTKELRKGLSNVKIQIFAGLGISSLVFSVNHSFFEHERAICSFAELWEQIALVTVYKKSDESKSLMSLFFKERQE